jgi:hypothetical protein
LSIDNGVETTKEIQMTRLTKTQTRGHCQCCGNQQAVKKGHMSAHGYTVQHGWFEGVCMGQRYLPIEQDRTMTDKIVAQIHADIDALRVEINDLTAGRITPAKAKSGKRIHDGKRWTDELINFADAEEHYQRYAVEIAIDRAEARIRTGEGFAKYLSDVADQYHGKDLLVINLEQKESIYGQKRVLESGRIAEEGPNQYAGRGRVTFSYVYTDSEGVKRRRQSYTSPAAWRKLPLAD